MAKSKIYIPGQELADLCRRHHVRQLALFGSVLRDDFRPDSDVDVLVEFEPQAHVGFIALGHLQRELAALFQRPVDVVPQDGLKPLIRDQVLSDARVLYAA